MSTKGNKRKSLYLSGVRDKDILEYIEPLTNHYDFSQVIRELVRDGIKYRRGASRAGEVNINTNTNSNTNVIQSMTPTSEQSMGHIILKKKEVKDEDLESRLDNF